MIVQLRCSRAPIVARGRWRRDPTAAASPRTVSLPVGIELRGGLQLVAQLCDISGWVCGRRRDRGPTLLKQPVRNEGLIGSLPVIELVDPTRVRGGADGGTRAAEPMGRPVTPSPL
jgi:hypothetical protein